MVCVTFQRARSDQSQLEDVPAFVEELPEDVGAFTEEAVGGVCCPRLTVTLVTLLGARAEVGNGAAPMPKLKGIPQLEGFAID
jgi:hypothetical protein